MTKVGPLLPMGDACGFEEEEPVVEATTSGKHAGGLGEDDLNLLSSMESNSANCSMVLEDMDLLKCEHLMYDAARKRVTYAQAADTSSKRARALQA